MLQKNIPVIWYAITNTIRVFVKRIMSSVCEEPAVLPPIVCVEPKKVITEDLGKIFEMSICLLYETEYDGKYKYSVEAANTLKERISALRHAFPHKLKHIAKNGCKYDFVDAENSNLYLSAKTTKKDGKVCPQVIGQPSKKKFCEFFGIEVSYSLDQIKEYIEQNPHKLLHIYFEHTFDCPVIYYNKYKNLLWLIRRKTPIDWENYTITFLHIVKNKKWNESSGVIIHGTTIGEFQVHNHRDCIKFRWAFEKLLDICKDNFEITTL